MMTFRRCPSKVIWVLNLSLSSMIHLFQHMLGQMDNINYLLFCSIHNPCILLMWCKYIFKAHFDGCCFRSNNGRTFRHQLKEHQMSYLCSLKVDIDFNRLLNSQVVGGAIDRALSKWLRGVMLSKMILYDVIQ